MDTPRGKKYLDPIRRVTPECLMKMLEPVDNFEMDAPTETEFENDFTDPYEEITKDYISMKKEYCHLSSTEINKIVMNSFTEEFKKAIADFRTEMRISDKPIFEDIILDVKLNTKAPVAYSEITKERLLKRENALKDPPFARVEWKMVEQSKYPEDYSEALWRDLEIRCENSQFRITPIGYNAHTTDKTPSKKSDDVPREQIEIATRKCTHWLDKYYKIQRK